MKKFASILFFLLSIFFLSVNVLAGENPSKWQLLLEKNGVPMSFWQKYLPKVSRAEYQRATKNYEISLGITSTDDSDKEDDDEDPDIIEGKYSLPETSGKIAKEQHLWLGGRQSAALHYAISGTPISCRNGMAGGYGAFGPLKKNDRQEEKYYVTMRWRYADWVEPESELSSDLSRNALILQVKDGKDFAKSGYVRIDNEYLKYSSRDKNKLKGLKRGFRSSAIAHKKGQSVKQVYRYKGGQWERLTRTLRIDQEKKDWYKKQKVLVENKRNGKKVIASVLESGPAIWTNRVGGLSPEAFDAIGAKHNENCSFSFVGKNEDLGKVD